MPAYVPLMTSARSFAAAYRQAGDNRPLTCPSVKSAARAMMQQSLLFAATIQSGQPAAADVTDRGVQPLLTAAYQYAGAPNDRDTLSALIAAALNYNAAEERRDNDRTADAKPLPSHGTATIRICNQKGCANPSLPLPKKQCQPCRDLIDARPRCAKCDRINVKRHGMICRRCHRCKSCGHQARKDASLCRRCECLQKVNTPADADAESVPANA